MATDDHDNDDDDDDDNAYMRTLQHKINTVMDFHRNLIKQEQLLNTYVNS